MKHKKFTYTMMDELMASPTEPITLEKRRHQLLRMWEGLRSMEREPSPSTDDWRVVSDSVNLMETLVEMKVVEDTSGLLYDAVSALALAGKRYFTSGTIRLDAQGIQAVRAVLEDYASLLDVLPARAVIRCHRLTERRIHEITQGKRKPHDIEICSL